MAETLAISSEEIGVHSYGFSSMTSSLFSSGSSSVIVESSVGSYLFSLSSSYSDFSDLFSLLASSLSSLSLRVFSLDYGTGSLTCAEVPTSFSLLYEFGSFNFAFLGSLNFFLSVFLPSVYSFVVLLSSGVPNFYSSFASGLFSFLVSGSVDS